MLAVRTVCGGSRMTKHLLTLHCLPWPAMLVCAHHSIWIISLISAWLLLWHIVPFPKEKPPSVRSQWSCRFMVSPFTNNCVRYTSSPLLYFWFVFHCRKYLIWSNGIVLRTKFSHRSLHFVWPFLNKPWVSMLQEKPGWVIISYECFSSCPVLCLQCITAGTPPQLCFPRATWILCVRVCVCSANESVMNQSGSS